jgi:hypothetical protein
MLTLTQRENEKEVKHQFHAHQIPNVDLCIQLLAHLRGVANLQHGDEALVEPLSDDETKS